jgi:two-component system, LytTR family, sensor kinase
MGFGLLTATQTVTSMRAEGMQHAWTRLFFEQLFCWLVWALATPLIQWLGQNFPLNRSNPIRNWPLHLLACTAIGATSALWEAWLDNWLRPWSVHQLKKPLGRLWLTTFRGEFELYLILYTAILIIAYYVDSKRRLAQREIEAARLREKLSQAQLAALRRQLEPHFLFNTLNGIAALVRDHRNDHAVEMIAGLSELLRQVLDSSEQQEVPLGEEMELLQKYLNLQRMRFGNRLQVSVEIPPELFGARIPNLLLQPLVENAIQHGISKRTAGGAIRIAAARQNDRVLVSIYNDGPGLPSDWENKQGGIGITNAISRLQSHYGKACDLHLRNHESGGVEVSLSLPCKLSSV